MKIYLSTDTCIHLTQTSVILEQRTHGDPMASKKIVDRRGARSALQVDAEGSHRTQPNGAYFEHSQNELRGLALP